MSEYDAYQEFWDFLSRDKSIVINLSSQILSIGCFIFMIVVNWFLFQKANQPGWASLIPFYNGYITFKIAGKKKLFWGWMAAQIIYIIMSIVMVISMIFLLVAVFISAWDRVEMQWEYLGISSIVFLISLVIMGIALIVLFVFRIFQAIGLAENFQAERGFAVGIIFLPIVFLPILAFSSKYQYCGEDGVKPNIPQFLQQGQVPPQYSQAQQYGQPPQYSQAQQCGQPPQYSQAQQYGQPPRYSQAQQYGQPPQYDQTRQNRNPESPVNRE